MLDIAEVARRSGWPASTLRYWEERGLIQSDGRHGLRRIFDPQVLDIIAVIGLMKWAGFSLEEIAAWTRRDGRVEIDRAALTTRAEALDAQVARLTVLAQMLRHTAQCPAPSHLDCPSFQRMLAEVRPGGQGKAG
ncbi:helix-turn-helix domain-containing protein [Pseudooceanicola sp. C21-150M6]|uniref:helix-turn-helix domain-containing protein n=1 Tax=Pseudooceanicola sp. C21-150M6 TaxID=3434355 RepID=UPI003D7FAB88